MTVTTTTAPAPYVAIDEDAYNAGEVEAPIGRWYKLSSSHGSCYEIGDLLIQVFPFLDARFGSATIRFTVMTDGAEAACTVITGGGTAYRVDGADRAALQAMALDILADATVTAPFTAVKSQWMHGARKLNGYAVQGYKLRFAGRYGDERLTKVEAAKVAEALNMAYLDFMTR